jgi:hypothetical protein
MSLCSSHQLAPLGTEYLHSASMWNKSALGGPNTDAHSVGPPSPAFVLVHYHTSDSLRRCLPLPRWLPHDLTHLLTSPSGCYGRALFAADFAAASASYAAFFRAWATRTSPGVRSRPSSKRTQLAGSSGLLPVAGRRGPAK